MGDPPQGDNFIFLAPDHLLCQSLTSQQDFAFFS